MKTEKEIKEFLVKTEQEYEDAVKCKQKYLQIAGSSVINTLRWVLEMEPYNFNKEQLLENFSTQTRLPLL